MKRLFLLLLIPILLCACAEKEAVVESSTESGPYLEISSQQWSGWSPGAEFEVHTERYELVEGCEIELEHFVSPLVLTINRFSDNDICLITSEALWAEVSDGSHYTIDAQAEITISADKVVTLKTPSFDAGYIYTLTYVTNTGE